MNSSDYEDDPSTTIQPSTAIGKRLNAAIVRNQIRDRLTSKRSLRTLTHVRGAPGTAQRLSYAANAFNAYRKVNNIDVDSCPDGETIYRFVVTLVENIQSNQRGKDVPSISTINGLWVYTIEYLKFQYRDLHKRYTNFEVVRIETYLDQQVTLGKLTRGLWQKREWLGVLMVQKLVRAFVRNCLVEGTLSYDIMLLRVVGVVLQCALSCRPGDVARSTLYTGMELLCYRDVELTLQEGGKCVQDLRAKVTLRFVKEYKRDTNVDEIKFFDPLTNPEQSIICPIKLLLAHALRHGYTYGLTIDQVVQHTSQRVDRILQWKKPDAPVLCGMLRTSAFINLEAPASPKLINVAIKEMGLQAGVLQPISARSIRNGSARDIAFLKKPIAGTDHRSVALAIAHTEESVRSGTTGKYIGALEDPIYNLRADNPHQDRLAPALTDNPMKRNRLKKHETDAYMKAHNMDVNDSNARQRASRAIKNDAVDAWRAKEQDRPGPVPPSKKQRTSESSSASSSRFSINTSNDMPERLKRERPSSLTMPAVITNGDSGSESTPPILSDTFPDELIDPALLTMDVDAEVDPTKLNDLITLIQPGKETPLTPAEIAGLDSQIEDILGSFDRVENDPLSLEGDAFVAYFASINVFKNLTPFDHNDDALVKRHVPTGNSRDKPVPFLFHCAKECGYTSWLPSNVSLHEVACDGQKKADGKFRCTWEGCTETYTTKGSLKRHVNTIHQWEVRQCGKCPHSPDSPFYENAADWNAHQRTHDPSNILQEMLGCPLKNDCHSERAFDKIVNLKNHLRKKHLLTSMQIGALLGSKPPRPKFSPTTCVIDGCKSKKLWPSVAALLQHLLQKHKMTRQSGNELIMQHETRLQNAGDAIVPHDGDKGDDEDDSEHT